jgi:hypothetical protein
MCMYVCVCVCMYLCMYVHTYCVLTNPPIPSSPCDHMAKNKIISFYITREGTQGLYIRIYTIKYVHINVKTHTHTNPNTPTRAPRAAPPPPPPPPHIHPHTSETMRVHDTTKTSSDTPRDSDNSHVEPTGPLRSAQVSNATKKHVSKES